MVSVKDKKEYIKKLIISFILCLLISTTVSFVITSGLLSNHSLSDSITYLRKWIFFYRAYLLTLALYFISFHLMQHFARIVFGTIKKLLLLDT